VSDLSPEEERAATLRALFAIPEDEPIPEGVEGLAVNAGREIGAQLVAHPEKSIAEISAPIVSRLAVEVAKLCQPRLPDAPPLNPLDRSG